MSASFASAFGLGSIGRYSAIHSDAVATDAAGDTFLTGSFRGTVGFDPVSTASTFTTNNTQDAFVAKYSPSGSLAWVRTFLGRATTAAGQATTYAVGQGSALAVDGSGNILVAGSFRGTVDFGPGPNPVELSSPSATEAFAAKLDPSGNLVWVSNAVGNGGDDQASAIAPDGSGGAVIAGSFAQGATFGGLTLPAGGASEAFAARVDSGGHFLWATASRGAANSNAAALGLAVDGSGNVVLAGFFSGQVALAATNGGAGATSTVITSAGSDDAAVWKLDSGGHYLWGRPFGSTDYDSADAVAVDASGNVYATGTFSGTVNFATGTTPDNLSAGSFFDAYTLKLDPAGNEAWARGFVGPNGWVRSTAIAVDPAGRVHVAGSFQGSADFDPGPGVANLASVGSTDAFAAGLDGRGDLLYALRAGQTNANAALGVAVNASGSVAITGNYSNAIGFGSIALPPAGVASIFLARIQLQSPPPPAPSAPTLEAASDTGAPNVTSNTAPAFDVTSADLGNTVELLRDGAIVGRRVGPGAIRDPGPVPQGTHAYTAIQVDPTGVAGPASPATSVMILTTPPTLAAPNLLPADDSGVVGDGLTTVRRPGIAGVGSPGGKVDWLAPDGSVLATATASAADGSYVLRASAAFANGTLAVRVRETDLAGNVGPASAPFALTIRATVGDYFGDGRTDFGIFRPGDNTFYLLVPSTGGLYAKSWAIPGDVPVSGDFYGDGRGDVAVYRPSNSTFYLFDPATAAVASVQWGAPGALPIPADYDGDGKADVAIYWPADSTFYVRDSATNAFYAHQFGLTGDIPVPADYFGNGHADIAVYRPSNSTFYIFDPITNATKAVTLGLPGDIPVPADYLGDGSADVAVFRPSTETYYIQTSPSAPLYVRTYGIPGDVPVAGDYFGAGHANLAVYRPSNSTFYALDPTNNAFQFRQWGANNTEKPISPPLSYSFRTPGSKTGNSFGTPGAIARFGGPSLAAEFVPPAPPSASPTIMPTPAAATKRADAHDLAVRSLGLERWRPGR